MKNHLDQKTAEAFASSWNNLPLGSIYNRAQFEEWMKPITNLDVKNKTVLELGCGNASLMVHLCAWSPKFIEGVDLGSSIKSAKENMQKTKFKNWQIKQADLASFKSPGFDIVYCIGVLHHLKNPKAGFDSVLRNSNKNGQFHCWVYGKEGNELILYIVDPLRKVMSKCPWWVTKYLVATPLAGLFFIYAKSLVRFQQFSITKKLPLFKYSLWISKREFSFFQHVAFDQLVTPQTTYFDRQTIESWLQSNPKILKSSIYLIQRNGNSWKFGGMVR